MSGQRLGLVTVGVVLVAALIWVARPPTVHVAPIADESFVFEPQPSVERETVDEPERETAELTTALTEAEAEIERLEAELAAARASLQEEDDSEVPFEPRGYSGKARVFVGDTRAVFEAELVDSSWAPAAESQLYENIVNKISSGGLQVNIVDVRCKTDACRVQMSYPRFPASMSELAEVTRPGIELSRQIFSETDSGSFSALLHVRGMFPGEATTSELYLFRTGTDGVVHTVESPQDLMFLKLGDQDSGGRSAR